MAKAIKSVVSKSAVSKAPTKRKIGPGVRSIRFEADPNTLVEIGFLTESGETMTHYGLVMNESQKGFAAVLVTKETFEKEIPCICRVGKMSDRYAIVRWAKKLERNLVELGFEYTT